MERLIKQFLHLTALLCVTIIVFLISALPAQANSHCTFNKKTAENYYSGPMIDTHFHMPSVADATPLLGRDVTMKEINCTLKAEGTERVFAFFPVYENVKGGTEQFIDLAERMQEKFPRRYVRFLMPPGSDDNPPTVGVKKIKKMVKKRWDLFHGFGEIGLYTIEGRDTSEYPPDALILNTIYKEYIEPYSMMVYLHPGEGHRDALVRALEKYPNINFIVHGEQIEDTGSIGELMTDHSNLYFTVNDLYGDQFLLRPEESQESFLEKTKDYETLIEIDLTNWQEAIEEHPNQFMWGTDRGGRAPWTFNKKVGKRLADYGRSFVGRLDPDVQEKFAYKNARRLIRQSKRYSTQR